jgi:hypothetical protein
MRARTQLLPNKIAEIEYAYAIQAKLHKEVKGWKTKLSDTDQLLVSQQETHQSAIRKMTQESSDEQHAIREEIAVLQTKMDGLLGFKQQFVN